MDVDITDAALVRAARRGDRDAFAALLERHRRMLLAVCRRLLGNHWLAEDIAQEASVQAMLSLDRLRSPDRFGAWLCGIGLNLARHALRESSADYWSLDALVGGRQIDEPVDGESSPAERAEEAELAGQVQRAVAELPRGQRAAVLLFYLSGLTHSETAAALDVDVGAVKQRLHKARIALRRRLAPTWRDERMEAEGHAQFVEMRVADVRRIPPEGDRTLQYVVVLEEVGGPRKLPIWVGRFEGQSLAQELAKVQLPRPPTYAFAASMLQAAGGQLREVVVSKLAEKIFYAQAIVGRAGKTRVVDARPSDALNLALVTGAPVRVRVELFEEAEKPEQCPPWRADLYGEGTAGAMEIAAEIAQS